MNARLSLTAAVVSLAGIAAGPLFTINPLPFFGIYCLLIAYLIARSTFAPRLLAVLMAGVRWLTLLSPSLTRSLSTYNFAPGLVAEGALTIWVLVFGATGSREEEAAGLPMLNQP